VKKWLGLFLSLALLLPAACNAGKPGELSYTAPYELSVDVGTTMPGTSIRYMGSTDQGAHFQIAGQDAYKQKGDSLSWSGTPLTSVSLSFSGRLVWYTDATAYVVGTSTVKVTDANPQIVSSIPEAPLRYRAVVTYNVGKGKDIPGTLVTYSGKSDQGAELSGLEANPFRKTGDSIVWQGKLREGVYLVVNVRTLFYTDSMLQVAGTAEVVLIPSA
jgi:hypothetical protein